MTRSRLWELLGVIFLLTLFAVIVTLPFVLVMVGTVNDSEDALQQSWILGWNVHQLLTAPLELYQAPIFYPFPLTLAYMDSMVPETLMAMPIILVTGSSAFAYNLEVLFTFVASGLAMYWLVRGWGGNYWGALVGGVMFAFGSYRLIHFGHLNLLSLQWLPLVLLYLRRSFLHGGRRNWFLYGVFFVLSALSSFYYAFIGAGMVAVYCGVMLLERRGRFTRAIWRGLLLTTGIALLVILPFAIPYIQVASEYARVRSLEQVISLSASPGSYFASTTITPALAWLHSIFPEPNWEAVLSPGWIALALAIYALFRGTRPWMTAALVSIALLGFLLSLGPRLVLGSISIPLPYQLLADVIPGFAGSMRAAARWGVLVLLAVAVLGGLGMSALTGRLALPRWATVAVVFVALLALLFEYDRAPLHPLKGQLLSEPIPPAYLWLKAQPAAAVVELPMGAPGQRYPPDTFYQYYALVYSKPIVNGYSGFAPPYYDTITNTFSTFPSSEAVDLARALAVRYIILHTDTFPDWDRIRARLELFSSVQLAASFGSTIIFEIAPAPTPGDAHFDLAVAHSVAPASRARGFLVVQTDASHMVRLTQQGTLDVQLDWRDASNQVIQTRRLRLLAPLTLDASGAVIPFNYDAPGASGTYRLSTLLEGGQQTSVVEQTVGMEAPAANEDSAVAELQDWNIPRRAARAGTPLKIILHWNVLRAPPADTSLFVHIMDTANQTVAETTVDPAADPLSTWAAGQTIVTQVSVPVPRRAKQGAYRVIVGLYRPTENQVVPIRGADGELEEGLEIGTAWLGANEDQTPPTISRPLQAIFDNGAELQGYDLPESPMTAGQTISIHLYWLARGPFSHDDTIFVHLVNAHGDIVAQADSPPRGGSYPTLAWNPGEWVRDDHALALPADLPSGDYVLRIGWYNSTTGARPSVVSANPITDDVVLTSLTIK